MEAWLVTMTTVVCLSMCLTVVVLVWWIVTRALPDQARRHAEDMLRATTANAAVVDSLLRQHNEALDQQGRRYQTSIAQALERLTGQLETVCQGQLNEIEKASRHSLHLLEDMRERRTP